MMRTDARPVFGVGMPFPCFDSWRTLHAQGAHKKCVKSGDMYANAQPFLLCFFADPMTATAPAVSP